MGGLLSLATSSEKAAPRGRRKRMKLKTFAIAVGMVLALFLFAQHRNPTPAKPEFSRVLDLTHTAGEHSPGYDTDQKLTSHVVATASKEGYFAREITLPEHFATHIDAPAHFAPGRWTVDQIPPERLLAPLVVIDVAEQAKKNPDYQLSADDIAEWEKQNGQMPPNAVIILRTGWSEKWDSAKDYRNADPQGVLHFPGYSLDAAKFLVESRQALGLGIDTLSVDYGPSKDFPVHHYTAGKSVYHLENVADVWRVPAVGALVLVAPAKIEGGSGGPVRILALLR
jgi:kynurenine formamidase